MIASERSEASARTLLGACATLTLVGIAFCIADTPVLGGWMVVASLVLMLYGLHRFGRSGADAPRKRRRRRQKDA